MPPPHPFLQALKRPEWLKEAQVGLESEQGVGFTTRPTDCQQVCWPTLRPFWLPPDLKTIQVHTGLHWGVNMLVMCPLYLPSSSRWPSGNPARRPEECTDKLSSGSYIPLNPLTARPIFVTAIVALRAHERTTAGRHFFFQGLQWRQSVGLRPLTQKTCPVLATGREFWSLQSTDWTRSHNKCRVIQSILDEVWLLCLVFFQKVTIFFFFLGKTTLPLICISWGSVQNTLDNSPQRKRKEAEEKLKVTVEQSKAKTPTLSLWIIEMA